MSAERPFTPALNAEPADWLVEQLTDEYKVSSIIPSGFEAYARVFHPASKVTCTADINQESTAEPLRWANVAELTGRTVHRTMQWASIEGSYPELDYTKLRAGDVYIEAPEEGKLPLELAQTLWPLLGQHTKNPNTCFFAIWEGFGGLPNFIREAPAFEIPGRRFYLFGAPLWTVKKSMYTGATYDDMGESFAVMVSNGEKMPSPKEIREMLRDLPKPEAPIVDQRPNLWWPEDHAWCVATEIDLNTTYIAGTQALIDTLLAHLELETYPAQPSDKITYNSDTVNPTPTDPYGSDFKLE